MTGPTGPSTARTALFIYLSMLGAVAVALVMSVSLQAARDFAQGGTGTYPDAMALAIAAAATLVFITVRRRLPVRRASETEEDWWRTNLPTALTLWATAESAALVGAVFHLVSGSPTALAATALGLALLAFSTPASLTNR
jgi:hypothetical protein